ncbi:alpha/beta fold hydrolase [Gammaproteobacteria bacterium]|nr:alpha/beta fold hydrolase [Gammaproteobacteria bacterium]
MGKILQVNNIELWYEQFGDPSNETVLLIMGANANCKQWDQEFIDNLVSHNLHVVRFDNRDVGKSTWIGKEPTYMMFLKILPSFLLKKIVNSIFGLAVDNEGKFKFNASASVKYNLFDMAKDAVSLMEALCIEKAHIIGASMGGMITQIIALEYPEKVMSITPIMTSPGIQNESLSGPTKDLLEAIKKSFIFNLKGRSEDGVVEIYRQLTGSRFAFNEQEFREKLKPIIAHGNNPFSLHGAAVGASPDRTSRLNEIDVPTLVIHGTEDAILPLDHGIALADGIRDSKRMIMEGVGHEIPLELMSEIISAIIENIKSASKH